MSFIKEASEQTQDAWDRRDGLIFLEVKAQVAALPEEMRLAIFEEYCTHCGKQDPTCQCWNDD